MRARSSASAVPRFVGVSRSTQTGTLPLSNASTMARHCRRRGGSFSLKRRRRSWPRWTYSASPRSSGSASRRSDRTTRPSGCGVAGLTRVGPCSLLSALRSNGCTITSVACQDPTPHRCADGYVTRLISVLSREVPQFPHVVHDATIPQGRDAFRAGLVVRCPGNGWRQQRRVSLGPSHHGARDVPSLEQPAYDSSRLAVSGSKHCSTITAPAVFRNVFEHVGTGEFSSTGSTLPCTRHRYSIVIAGMYPQFLSTRRMLLHRLPRRGTNACRTSGGVSSLQRRRQIGSYGVRVISPSCRRRVARWPKSLAARTGVRSLKAAVI